MTIEWKDEQPTLTDSLTLDIIRMLDGFKRTVTLRMRFIDPTSQAGQDAKRYYAGVYRAIFETEAIIRSESGIEMRGKLPDWVLRHQSLHAGLE